MNNKGAKLSKVKRSLLNSKLIISALQNDSHMQPYNDAR